tara:strand:- start:6147 stop:6362 length:216 start_codon:yes stop_codon:yes gene_type:complete
VKNNMSWETSNGDILFAEVDNDTLAFILQINGKNLTALISRGEAESLASFLAEWCGFPMYFYSEESDFIND